MGIVIDIWYGLVSLYVCNIFQGKPTSRLRPEFVIFDPQLQNGGKCIKANSSGKNERKFLLSPAIHRKFRNHSRNRFKSDNSDSETDDSCVSTPRMQRRKPRQSSQKQSPFHLANATTDKGATVPPPVLPEVSLVPVN